MYVSPPFKPSCKTGLGFRNITEVNILLFAEEFFAQIVRK